ncbi:leucocin A/sakacin P family class II bacteriocin [Latilactobacillus sakei]
MNNVKELSMTELQTITGGARSYGNGVYCNNKKCWVNRGEATQSIIGGMISGWASGLVGM